MNKIALDQTGMANAKKVQEEDLAALEKQKDLQVEREAEEKKNKLLEQQEALSLARVAAAAKAKKKREQDEARKEAEREAKRLQKLTCPKFSSINPQICSCDNNGMTGHRYCGRCGHQCCGISGCEYVMA